MGFGVFGSQIVLAGGGKAAVALYASELLQQSYVLEIDSSVGDGTLKFIKGSPSVGGKLYALNTLPTAPSDIPLFKVYDSETKVWTALPDPPIDPVSMDCSGFFSCAVLGTKILVSP
ncbi:hypothetical protein M0R45_009511 [Rubus argutus]